MEINILTKQEVEEMIEVGIRKKTSHIEKAIDELRLKVVDLDILLQKYWISRFWKFYDLKFKTSKSK